MGAKNWNKTSIWYNQTTKIIEYFLEDLKAQGHSDFWLQSCNVSASCCGIEAVGGQFRSKSPVIDSKTFMSQADIMFSFIYSKYGRTLLPVKPVVGVIESELMVNLTFAINKLSTAKATSLFFANSKELVETMKKDLNDGCAVVLSYLTDYGSGHYITVVNWRDGKFYAYDSWAGNKHCSKGGVLEEYSPDFFIKRARHRYIKIV